MSHLFILGFISKYLLIYNDVLLRLKTCSLTEILELLVKDLMFEVCFFSRHYLHLYVITYILIPLQFKQLNYKYFKLCTLIFFSKRKS
jgi:hypothetical protein